MERTQSTKMVSKSVSVGIERTLSEYISQVKPNRVEGYVKLLLEDFHVHEIDTEGKVLSLGKSYKIEEVRRAVERKRKRKTGERFLSVYEEDKDKLEYPQELFTETDKLRLKKLLKALSEKAKSFSGQEKMPATFLVCRDSKDAKATRTGVHRWIRATLPFLDSKTVEFGASQRAGKMKELLDSHLDLSALPQDYSLIRVAPTPACLKYISGRLRNTYSTSEHTSTDNSNNTNDNYNTSTNNNSNETNNTNDTNETNNTSNNNTNNRFNTNETNNTSNNNTNNRFNNDNNRNYVSISGSNYSSGYGANFINKKEEHVGAASETTSQIKENYNSDSDSESSVSLEEIVKELDGTDYEKYNPKSYGKFLHFNMLKINRETSEVVHMMCKSANRGSFDFFSAGNKDKRGITVQRICIRRCNIESILEAMTRGWYNDVHLSDFCYKNTKIGLGDLKGNHFKIVIRGIEEATNIDEAIETLKSYGFINYFGLQRFGTKIVGTHIIGASIIDQRYDMTLRLILGDIETAKHYAVFNKYFENMDAVKLSLNPEYVMSHSSAAFEAYDAANAPWYGNDNAYASTGVYPNTEAYANTGGYATTNTYAKTAAYTTTNNYATTDGSYNPETYATTNTYATTDASYNPETYATTNTYATTDASYNPETYATTNTYATTDASYNPETYATTNTYATTDASYNPETYATTDGNYEEQRVKVREEMPMKYRKATDYYLFDNDAETALKYIPMRFYVEKSVLKGIMANMSNEKCLEKVPKNILTIYVHSTQSLLFNLAATERLNRYGLKVVPGDLVVTSEKGMSESGEEYEEERTQRVKRMTVIEVNSEEEAERYTIEQVVLPLPGDNIKYPSNMKDYYEQIAVENYNIKLENFKTNKEVEGKKQKCIVSVGGSYRFIIVKPKDVSYEVIEKLEEPLKVLIRPEIEGYEEDIEKYESARSIERIQKLGDKIRNKAALKLKCSLPKSSYITVALREILKDESIENNHG